MSKVNVHEGEKILNLEAPYDLNLLSLLNKNGFNIANPCGGKGTCGKCKIKVDGTSQVICDEERKLLGEKSIEDGYRLACYLEPSENMNVFLNTIKHKAVVVTDSKTEDVELNTYILKTFIKTKDVRYDNAESDYNRFLSNYKIEPDNLNLDIIRKLPSVLSNEQSGATLVYFDDELIDVEFGDTRDMKYGIGIDIGTTTVAAYLVNLNTGKTESVYSSLNPQKAFGDDVITRINYTMENTGGINDLKDIILYCINDAVNTFAKEAGIDKNHIYAVNIAGNTTMLHMAMGLDCKKLALSPFIPVTTELHRFPAKELSININPNGKAAFLPCVSSYVGADTLCAVLSSNMHKEDSISLLVDIGTNGEIVLGSKKGMFSCSVAAGPAFEGAHLRNGVGGIYGAIDKVLLTKNIDYTTIGSGRPLGICGSGIVDAIAQLLVTGIIDATGRILDEDELPLDLSYELKHGITEVDGMRAFALYISDEPDKSIYVTQKDIREIQNAKAAIAAGIKTLIKKAEINFEAIDNVYLAGGFGSYINIESAIKIGLLPKELTGKVTSIGNAAGAGAVQTLISYKSLKQLKKIKSKISYVELSGNNEFTDLYISSMMLE